jgi:hypothetical protein
MLGEKKQLIRFPVMSWYKPKLGLPCTLTVSSSPLMLPYSREVSSFIIVFKVKAISFVISTGFDFAREIEIDYTSLSKLWLSL